MTYMKNRKAKANESTSMQQTNDWMKSNVFLTIRLEGSSTDTTFQWKPGTSQWPGMVSNECHGAKGYGWDAIYVRHELKDTLGLSLKTFFANVILF